jgi:hypothetical protein
MIKKAKGGYKVVSENGKKNLGGPYRTKAEAKRGCVKSNISSITRVRGFCSWPTKTKQETNQGDKWRAKVIKPPKPLNWNN